MAILLIEHIESTPEVCGGQPRVAGTRIRVQDVVVYYTTHQWSIGQIAEELELTPAEIHAALSYYYDHQAEIDEAIKHEAQAIPSTIGRVKTLLAERQISPDNFSYSSDGTFFVRFLESHPQYAAANRLLEQVPGVNIIVDMEVKQPPGDTSAVRSRYIKFTFTP